MALNYRRSLTQGFMAMLAAALCLGAPMATQAGNVARNAADDPEPDPGRIRLTVAWADPRVVCQFIGDGLTTVVQFYDANGQWQDVSGWVQPLRNTNTVLWNVWRRDWGTGPYRWVVKNAAKGYVMATTSGFYLPAAGTYLDLTAVIPANIAPPPPLSSALPAELVANVGRVDPAAKAFVTAAAVDVRRAPSATSFAFAELRRGVVAQVLGASPDRQWLQVSAQNVTGWIAARGGISLTPAAERVRVLSDYPTAMVGVRRLTVRALPTSASAAQGVLQMGDEVEVMAASADGAWFNVRFGAITGWIYAESTLKY